MEDWSAHTFLTEKIFLKNYPLKWFKKNFPPYLILDAAESRLGTNAHSIAIKEVKNTTNRCSLVLVLSTGHFCLSDILLVVEVVLIGVGKVESFNPPSQASLVLKTCVWGPGKKN